MSCDWENCTQPAVRNERYCALHMLEFQPDYVLDATDAWRQRAELAEAALAARDTPCMWRAGGEEGIVWYTACDQAHYFDEEGPMENSYQFCPYCGHPIKVQP